MKLCEIIWSFEAKYNLLDLEIDGVKAWQFRRMALYYFLSEKTGLLEQAHVRLTFIDKFLSLFMLIKNSFLCNPFFLKQTDVIIFPHERSKLVNNEYIDIYTHYLKNELNISDTLIKKNIHTVELSNWLTNLKNGT